MPRNDQTIEFRNRYLSVTFDPRGGKIVSLSGPGGQVTAIGSTMGGLAADTTRREGVPGIFADAVFEHETLRPDEQTNLARFRHVVSDGAQRGLEIQKDFELRDDDPAVRLHLTLRNTSAAPMSLAYRSHNTLWTDAARNTLLRLPTRRGMMRRVDNVDYAVRDLAAGWIAGVDPTGRRGLACIFDRSKIAEAFCWVGDLPTAEWIYDDTTILPGQTWTSDIAYVPFVGLENINIVREELIGHLRVDAASASMIAFEAFGLRDAAVTLEPVLFDAAGRECARLEPRSLALQRGRTSGVRWEMAQCPDAAESIGLLIGDHPAIDPAIPLHARYVDGGIDPAPFSAEFRAYLERMLVEAEGRCAVPSDAASWKAMRDEIIAGVGRIVGDDLPMQWPELSPRIESALQRKDFRIEQVSAEFWPGVRYAMHAFVPNGDGPFPAVIVMCSSPQGGRTPFYQNLHAALAQVGILSVGVTPIGKGVRYTEKDAYDFNEIAMLAGTSVRQVQHQTATRTLDYLITRADVDTGRICITGDSDGGGVALFAATVDARIAAVAPACITWTFSKWMLPGQWKTLVDEETAIPGLLNHRANIPTLVAANAPRPLRFLNAARETHLQDQIPIIDGTAHAAYQHAGAPENYSSSIADCEHGYWPEISAQFVPWVYELFFGRALERKIEAGLKLSENPFAQQLLIDGQRVDVVTADMPEFASLKFADLEEDAGGKAFLAIIEHRRLAARQRRADLMQHPDELRAELMQSLGLNGLKLSPSANGDARSIQLETEPGLHVPAEWMKQDAAKKTRALLVVGEAASRRRFLDDDALSRLDLSMREELALGPDLSLLVLLNRPPIGMWVWDCLSAARWLRERGHEQVDVIGVGDAGALIATFAGLLSDDIAQVRIESATMTSMDDLASRHPRRLRYWANRLLWITDLPEATEALRQKLQRRM